MKKIEKKLSLNKKTIAVLDNKEMANLKGGFTYSLSTGNVCRLSNALTLSQEECQSEKLRVPFGQSDKYTEEEEAEFIEQCYM
ncbi:MAG: rSAM-modified peptide [Acinetobacter sp.]|nr:MAG: rSAM-modified peptide [Acinetobacter sp.]